MYVNRMKCAQQKKQTAEKYGMVHGNEGMSDNENFANTIGFVHFFSTTRLFAFALTRAPIRALFSWLPFVWTSEMRVWGRKFVFQ